MTIETTDATQRDRSTERIEQVLADLRQMADRKRDAVLVEATEVAPALDDDGRPAIMARSVPGLLRPTRHARTQLASRLRIPLPYYDRMAQELPALWVLSVRQWMEHDPQPRLVRALMDPPGHDGRLRGYLSNRYLVLDHLPMLETVLHRALRHGADTLSAHVDEDGDQMHVKLILPGAIEVVPGDSVQAGVIVSNSETGSGRVRVRPYLLRQVCSNGLIAADGYGQIHLGGQAEAGILTDETIRIRAQATWREVGDHVESALAGQWVDQAIAQLREAQGVAVSHVPVRYMAANIAREGSLTQTEAQSVIEHYLRADGYTGYDLIQAVTRSAQDASTYDRQVEVEELGGKLLGMGSAKLQRMVERPVSERQLAKALG